MNGEYLLLIAEMEDAIVELRAYRKIASKPDTLIAGQQVADVLRAELRVMKAARAIVEWGEREEGETE